MPQALAELRAGQKQSHWMWFIFPQIAGLGKSPMSRAFAIQSLAEARAYLAHPVLGARLRECGQALMNVRNKSADDIFGSTDEMKLRSCLTLFAEANPDEVLFYNLLEKYFDGERRRGDAGNTFKSRVAQRRTSRRDASVRETVFPRERSDSGGRCSNEVSRGADLSCGRWGRKEISDGL